MQRYSVNLRNLILFICLLLCCVDSVYVNQGVYCSPDFYPVCGCNKKTYKNACEAQYHAGVQYFTQGPCEPIAINFYPDPVISQMTYQVSLRQQGDLYVYIMDLYGKVYYQVMYGSVQNQTYYLDLTNLPTNIYFLIIGTSGSFTVKKFVKMQNY